MVLQQMQYDGLSQGSVWSLGCILNVIFQWLSTLNDQFYKRDKNSGFYFNKFLNIWERTFCIHFKHEWCEKVVKKIHYLLSYIKSVNILNLWYAHLLTYVYVLSN
jgi:hypothetical protein